MNAPTVFISYSHDSLKHADRVLKLADRLVSDGIDVILDQYEAAPPEGWPRWMDKKIRDSNFILMVCTETYYRRVMGEEKAGTGLGVKWEGNLIYQHIYNADTINFRFIPILFDYCKVDYIPTPLGGAPRYKVDSPDDYENLYRHITNQPRVIKPEIGKLKPYPPRERKMDYINDYVDEIKQLIETGFYNEAYDLCRSSLLALPNHPVLNLLSAIALLRGKGADRLQENLIPRIEEHLRLAHLSAETKHASLAIWMIIKYDRYIVNGLNEGVATLDELKAQINYADLSHAEMTYVKYVKASDGALSILGAY